MGQSFFVCNSTVKIQRNADLKIFLLSEADREIAKTAEPQTFVL